MHFKLLSIPFLCLAWFTCFTCSSIQAAEEFYQTYAGFIPAKDLTESFKARIISISFDQRDAFDGSTAHSKTEKKLFAIGNKLHIASKQKTIERRLLFKVGEFANKILLTETEKNLRSEEFLSDAIIEVNSINDSTCEIRVTTFDQWTTILAAGASLRGLAFSDLMRGSLGDADLPWWVGISESNLFGGGTKVGAALRHDRLRDTRELTYRNTNVSPLQLQISAYGGWRSDGDSLLFKIEKPLLSSTDKFAFSINLVSMESAERIYFDANQFSTLPVHLAKEKSKSSNELRLFEGVTTHEINLSATRSFGYRMKFNLGPTFDFYDHYGKGKLGPADTALIQNSDPLPTSALEPEARTHALLGLSTSLYRYTFQSSRNYHNLKWNESIPVGWRLNSKVAFNQTWLGAKQQNVKLTEEVLYHAAWNNLAFLNLGTEWQSFFNSSGQAEDGQVHAWWEAQWKPISATATLLSGAGTALLNAPKSRQLLLGEINGLNGFPSYYYAGQGRLLFTAEQRFFPTFEFLTAVPAFAITLSAGNTYPSISEINVEKLHYSLGFGLRIGNSKSTTRVVQHLNLCWPLGERYRPGPLISYLAKKSL